MPEKDNSVSFGEELSCDDCGRPGAYDYGDQHLCGDCLQGRGSCCPEFGKEEPEQGNGAGCLNS